MMKVVSCTELFLFFYPVYIHLIRSLLGKLHMLSTVIARSSLAHDEKNKGRPSAAAVYVSPGWGGCRCQRWVGN